MDFCIQSHLEIFMQLSNCDAGENSWESLGLQGDQSPSSVNLKGKQSPSEIQENNPEYSLVGLMLKLKWQCFGHLMQRANSLEKTLMMGKIEGRRRRGRQRVRWLNGISDSVDMSLSQLWEIEKDRRLVCFSPWGHKKSDTTEWLNNMPLIFQCLNSKRKSASLYSDRNRNAKFYYLYQNQLPNYSDIGTNVLTHCLSICSSRAESETGACMPGILIPRSRDEVKEKWTREWEKASTKLHHPDVQLLQLAGLKPTGLLMSLWNDA